MNEPDKKPTAAQRKQAERNRDAAQRQRDLLLSMLEARKKLAAIKSANYKPGPDFKAQLAFQQKDEFWEQSRIVDEVDDKLKLVELEGSIAQLEDRIKVYTETLAERG